MKLPGAVYHCIARIVGGSRMLGDREKEVLRRMMWRQAEFCGVEIVTYCLMSNHIHLLIRVPESQPPADSELVRRLGRLHRRGRRVETWVKLLEENFARSGTLMPDVRKRLLLRMGDVSVFMKELKQRFSVWYNRTHERFGTLWAERFKSVLVEDKSEALRIVTMYIDLNPVRAGMVEDPKEYRFCGYAEAVAGNRAMRKSLTQVCGAKSWRVAGAEYRCELIAHAGDGGRADRASLSREKIEKVLASGGQLTTAELLRLRVRYFSDGAVLGSKEFVESVFQQFRDHFGQSRRNGARKICHDGGALKGLCSARDLKSAPIG